MSCIVSAKALFHARKKYTKVPPPISWLRQLFLRITFPLLGREVMSRRIAFGAGWIWLAIVALLVSGASAMAQGILIIRDDRAFVPLPRPWPMPERPQPPASYKIKELSVEGRLLDQVARIQVSQTFVNTGSRQMEVQFVFPLPYDGAIDALTFMVDGKEYEAKLLGAAEARKIYEGYVRRSQDPALLEWVGTGMFQTSVFPVPPGAERKVTMKYTQLMRKYQSLTDFLFPLGTAKYTDKPVEKVSINLSLESAGEIKNIYSPTHTVQILRADSRHATVKYEMKDQVPVNDFRLFFDSAAGKLGTSVISYRPDEKDDGYFLLLASPEISQSASAKVLKDVVIVVDRSGSMSGKKIEQAKEALKFVIQNLVEGDRFNVVAYDNAVESFKPDMVKYSKETRDEATGYANGIYPQGGTNIDGALTRALDLIGKSDRPSFIVFLTDGLPTIGETNEAKIIAKATQSNKSKARLITFGVGYDVNSRLLDRLSHDNRGQSEFVRPDESIESHVAKVYSRISSPVMSDVAVDFGFEGVKVEDGSPISRRYPREVHDVFAGEQLVVVGRYKKTGKAKITVKGKVGDREDKMEFEADLTAKSPDQSLAFVEKLWAMRRIGEIIDQIDLNGKNSEMMQELIALSTKHGILTPYTSFLADDQPVTGPGRPGGPLADASLLNRQSVNESLKSFDRLADADGASGFGQRAAKAELKGAALAPGNGGFGGGRGANGPGKPGDPSAPLSAAAGFKFRELGTDKEIAADAVQQIGGETLYKRGKLWISANAATVDLEKDKATIKVIERFSDEYFALVKENKAEENAVLSRQQPGEELLVKFRGQAYMVK